MARPRFAHLPVPSFVERDGPAILAALIADFESRTGKPLVPTQVERILLDLMAYRELLLRIAIQEAALQNLVPYAAFPMVDHLAALGGAERLGAQPARAPQRFTIPAPLGVPSPVPSGTRVRSRDGKVTFTTDVDTTILAGATTVDVAATATTLGPLGNDYAPGQVDDLLDVLGFTVSAANISATSGGTPAEDSDRLAERIPDAIRALSVAGPSDAYRYFALSAHPDIVDVSVSTPNPGTVLLTVLTRTGAASAPIQALVLAAASARTVRPICDTVQVESASGTNFVLTAQLTLLQGAPTSDTRDAAEAAVIAYTTSLKAKLGRPPIPSQIVKLLSVPGVHSVTLVAPGVTVVGTREWANCTAISVTVVGYWSPPS